MPGCGHCWHGPEPELQISLGTHENMPERMSEYKSVSESVSDRMPVGGDHSRTRRQFVFPGGTLAMETMAHVR